MNKPVTLADVAKAAGVAVGTASRVLNNFTDVSPDSRQRVLEAVARLRYQPLRKRQNSGGGRGRAGQRSHNIGLVYLGMDDTLLHVPVLTEVLHGIESAITLINGNLLFANLPNADHVPAFLKENQVEGLIVKTSQYSALPDVESNSLIKNILRFPLVWTWAKPEGAPGDLCSFNHESAARLVAGHLLERGHRRVAFLNPKKGKSSLEHIKKEFMFACGQREMALTLLESASPRVTAWPEPALTSHEELLPLVDQWRAMDAAVRPTAIFLPADNIVVHLYTALERRGLQVGRDVSVISCNNEKSVVRALKPSLTTIDVGAQRIGTRAVEQLLWRLRNPLDDSIQTVLLEATLVPGDSVARI
ncbi:MAG: LacI family DNA-binding transcriptional regulator [Opitutaceae bacterium]|nr:LacI family DNA-binding transcriptional regulator [Opitutaceae bacterium]